MSSKPVEKVSQYTRNALLMQESDMESIFLPHFLNLLSASFCF